ncbi:roadblock/LC7 domain-containing protein [Streptomyces sp. S07_1.15]|uniref:roadblock/LC7 domain-containing protein n=1 Tax=Streptomyces sp. S07_1.15 TaxID=2873925 RepID=UPI001D143580|nr:roadblock/LC7 domain-containing protein [Streptomyces sp. S07_1.15]MCC3654043.1 roadblock/LC7 domain-containing protein [Streptomyces sp. S07_1.15]
MNPPSDHAAEDIRWTLDDLLKLPGVRHALVLTSDGLVRTHSDSLHRDTADRMAAAISSYQAAARTMAEFCDEPQGSWQQGVTEFGGGFVFLIAAGTNGFLAVATDKSVEMHVVTARMHHTAGQLGTAMSSDRRPDAGRRP